MNILYMILDFIRYIPYRIQVFLTKALMRRSKKARARSRWVTFGEVNHLFLYTGVLIYSEILLRLFTSTGVLQHLIYPIGFAIAYGAFINIFTTVFPKKINRRIMMIVLAVTGVLYCMECLIHSSYQTYMTLQAVVTGAGGVMTGYLSELVASIVGGIIPIVLFMLPTVIYLLRGKRISPAHRYRPYFAIVMLLAGLIVFELTAFAAGHGSTREPYKDEYEFDTAVMFFGLPSGLRLSLTRSQAAEEEGFAMDGMDLNDNEDESGAAIGESNAAGESAVFEETEEAATAPAATAAGTGGAFVTESTGTKTENVMNIDFQKLMDTYSDENVTKVSEYVQSLTPSNVNAYTGLFKGKNLIMICAEAFSDAVITKKLTPTLYRMLHKGIYFTDYYQPTWGGSTITGELSFITGLVPTNGIDTIYETIGDNEFFTMGNQLQKLGYFNAAFHNGRYNYYKRDTTHYNFGYANWLAQNNGLEKIAGRYPSDENMIVKTLETYADQQPFSVYYMTIAGHAAYKSTSKYVTRNLEYVKEHVGRKYSDKALYYLCYQYELEKAMKALINKLEELGIADDTVICLTADHYPYGLAKSSTWGNDKNYVADLYGSDTDTPWDRDHSALIIWSGCLEHDQKEMATKISSPTYSLDILPTLSNLFGLDYDSRLLVGRDVFSDQSALVLWPNGSWVTTQAKYNAKKHEYVTVKKKGDDEEYRKTIKNLVKNKIYYSKQVRALDYWGLIFGEDTYTSDNRREGTSPLTPKTEVIQESQSGDETEEMQEEMEEPEGDVE